MKNKDLIKGDRVVLSDDTRWNTKRESNPLGVMGTVIDPDESYCMNLFSGHVFVRWDNGVENTYKEYEDDLVRLEND
jgi:hypothetical protein